MDERASRPRVVLLGIHRAFADHLASQLSARGCDCRAYAVAAEPQSLTAQADLVLLERGSAPAASSRLRDALRASGCTAPIVAVDWAAPSDALVALASLSRRRSEPPGAARTAPSVLLADDDEELRQLLRLSLEASGLRVAEAADGREAIEAIELTGPDAVLLDVMMPRLDGPGVLARIGRMSPRPAVVLYSAYIDPHRQFPNVAAVLRKPVPMHLLAETLRAAAQREQPAA